MEEKRNGFKKIAVIVSLTAMLVFSVAMTVFADGATIDPDAPVSLTLTKYEADEDAGDGTILDESVTGKPQTVTGRDPMADVEFTVLKVAELKQSNKNGTVGLSYLLTKDGATVLSKSGTTYAEGQEVTIDELKTFIAQKTARDTVFVGLQDMDNAVTAKTGADGMVKFTSDTSVAQTASVKHISSQGLYLVVETAAPDNVTKRTHPFFVALPMSDRATMDEWQYDVYAYPKNTTGEIDFNKQISQVNNVNQSGEMHTAEADIGDVITFRIPFTMAIPSDGLTKLGIEDTLSKGLTFQTAGSTAGSADVTINRVDGEASAPVAQTNYTVTAVRDGVSGETKLTIDFTAAYIKTLNEDVNNLLPQFEVIYKAVLNEDAVLGTLGNPNKAHAYYRNSTMTSDEDDKTTPDAETEVYTWGIDLVKKGESNNTLQNVEFTLTNDEDKTYKFEYIANGSNGYYIPSGETAATETLKTDSAGKLVIRGLKSDVYYLKEMKTASGYILLKDPIQIVITGESTTGLATATVNGTDVTLTQDTLNLTSQSALVPVTVVNSKGFVLPSTGGTGTALITMTGIVLVIISSVLLIRMGRKKRREASDN